MILDGKHQIIAIGDSLTAGWQKRVAECAPFEDRASGRLIASSYPYMLGEMLSRKWGGDLILNLGRNGSATQHWTPGAAWRKKGWRRFSLNGKPLDDILEFTNPPRVCLALLGSNDVLHSILPDRLSRAMGGVVGYEEAAFAKTQENLLSLLTGLRGKGILTLLAKIPLVTYRGGLTLFGVDRLIFNRPNAQERLVAYTAMVNRRIEEIWRAYPNLAKPGPDLFHLLKRPSDVWSGDRLHPNTRGYRRMAEAWFSVIRAEGIEIQDAPV